MQGFAIGDRIKGFSICQDCPFSPVLLLLSRRTGVMKQISSAIALGLGLAASGFVGANASVPLPVVQQASGIPTLAPLLKKITPAVVGISIKSQIGRAHV